MEMSECPSFESCDASLCPLDNDLKKRVWYSDEAICSGRAGSGKRWIKKQRSIVRRQTKSWLDKPVTYQQLYDVSRPRKLTDAQRAELVSRMSRIRASHKMEVRGVGF
jgi:hypothetical protein